ncbi:acyltransferase family protein [Sphingomonas sp. 35-24ZXX]|uniref:acyltransferase family protein n=1 Tax=Sphingomonas sp. 35-24ZXX TaxID=1545915 RepID=UPI00053BFDD2|nr:acyltransferase [Sphingomonas sp. 35-24ZXX]
MASGHHIRTLDAARSIAALAVVCYHWRNLQPSSWVDLDRFGGGLPFFSVLRPIYRNGWIGVDFFFILSGFVMFMVYHSQVADRTISAARFAVLRFSRLYPLHFAMLMALVAMQAFHSLKTGGILHFPKDNYYDTYHFVLQLFFASNWGLQRGPSFNDPVWSVSIEVLLYGVFFMLLARTRASTAMMVGLSIFGFVLYAGNLGNAFGRGLFCFFIGCLLCRFWFAYRDRPWFQCAAIALFAGTWSVAGAALLLNADGYLAGLAGHQAAGMASPQIGAKVTERLDRVLFYLLVVVMLFPSLLLALVASEGWLWRVSRPLSAFGNVSYSSYLLHLPLMMLGQMLLGPDVVGANGVRGELVFISFFVLLLILSFASFAFFEKPLQRIIRARLA